MRTFTHRDPRRGWIFLLDVAAMAFRMEPQWGHKGLIRTAGASFWHVSVCRLSGRANWQGAC